MKTVKIEGVEGVKAFENAPLAGDLVSVGSNLKTSTSEEVKMTFAENAGSGKGKSFLPEIKSLATTYQQDQIRSAIQDRQIILVVGQTGSGRTQMLYAIADEVAALFPAERVAVLCDLAERLGDEPENLTCYAGSRDVTTEIRQSNTWLFVDELRGDEASSLLEAWSEGCFGGAAVHGASVEQSLSRLKSLAGAPFDQAVSERIHLVVLMEGTAEGPCVKEIHHLAC